jgi:hypothetical protein
LLALGPDGDKITGLTDEVVLGKSQEKTGETSLKLYKNGGINNFF